MEEEIPLEYKDLTKVAYLGEAIENGIPLINDLNKIIEDFKSFSDDDLLYDAEDHNLGNHYTINKNGKGKIKHYDADFSDTILRKPNKLQKTDEFYNRYNLNEYDYINKNDDLLNSIELSRQIKDGNGKYNQSNKRHENTRYADKNNFIENFGNVKHISHMDEANEKHINKVINFTSNSIFGFDEAVNLLTIPRDQNLKYGDRNEDIIDSYVEQSVERLNIGKFEALHEEECKVFSSHQIHAETEYERVLSIDCSPPVIFYLKVLPLHYVAKNSVHYTKTSLLHSPINHMIKRIEKDKNNIYDQSENQEYDRGNSSIDKKHIIRNKKIKLSDENRKHHNLWVDKYAPIYFKDLLSSEEVNREVLMWLKAWDPLVFPTNDRRKKILDAELPKDHKRVLLLGGPPGVGKTTLIRVVAKHCKYDTVELNASDERNKEQVFNTLSRVVECDAGYFKGKPTLCIMDEIDGATSNGKGENEGDQKKSRIEGRERFDNRRDSNSAIGAIVDFIKKVDRKGKPAIKRPVICICNDIWNRNLWALREKAKVVNLRNPSSHLLEERLRYICEEEDITADTAFIHGLMQLHNLDIRAIIHTLQFIATGAAKSGCTMLTAEKLNLYNANKDSQSDQLDFLRFVFANQGIRNSMVRISEIKQLDEMIVHLNCSMNLSQIITLINENYRQVVYIDIFLEKTAKLTRLLASSDIVARAGINEVLAAAVFAQSQLKNTSAAEVRFTFLSRCKDVVYGERQRCCKEVLRSLSHRPNQRGTLQLIGATAGVNFPLDIAPFILVLFTINIAMLSPSRSSSNDIGFVGDTSCEASSNCSYGILMQATSFLRGMNVFDIFFGGFGKIMNATKSAASLSKFIYSLCSILRIMVTYGLSFISFFDNSQDLTHTLGEPMFDARVQWGLDPPLELLSTFGDTKTRGWQHERRLYELLNREKDYYCSESIYPPLERLILDFLKGVTTSKYNHVYTEDIRDHMDNSNRLIVDLPNGKDQQLEVTTQNLFPRGIAISVPFDRIVETERLFAQHMDKSASNMILLRRKTYNGNIDYTEGIKLTLHSLNYSKNGYFRYSEGRCNAVKYLASADTY